MHSLQEVLHGSSKYGDGVPSSYRYCARFSLSANTGWQTRDQHHADISLQAAASTRTMRNSTSIKSRSEQVKSGTAAEESCRAQVATRATTTPADCLEEECLTGGAKWTTCQERVQKTSAAGERRFAFVNEKRVKARRHSQLFAVSTIRSSTGIDQGRTFLVEKPRQE